MSSNEKDNEGAFDPEKIAALLDLFRGKPVTQDALTAYCNRMKFDHPITMGEYQDYLFADAADEKKLRIFSRFLETMQKLKIIPELATSAQMRKIQEGNMAAERELMEVLKDEGVLFREYDLITSNYKALFDSMFQGLNNRIKNGAMRTMVVITSKEIGEEDMTIKALLDYKAPKADAKAEDAAPEAEKPTVEQAEGTPVAEKPADTAEAETTTPDGGRHSSAS